MGECRSCDAEIEWAFTAKGRRMPLDPEGVDPAMIDQTRGVQMVYTDGDEVQARPWPAGRSDVAEAFAWSVQRVEAEVRAGNPSIRLMTSHFATCPNAAVHRRH